METENGRDRKRNEMKSFKSVHTIFWKIAICSGVDGVSGSGMKILKHKKLNEKC